MPGIVVGESTSCSNPLVQFFHQAGGVMQDVAELSFRVIEKSTGTQRVATTVVNLAECPTGARVGPGRYAATFTPTSPTWKPGTHEVQWTYKPVATDPARTWNQTFEVLETGIVASGVGYVGYNDTSELLANTVFACYAVRDLHTTLMEVAQQIRLLTGRFFDPTFLSIQHNATNAGALPLIDPIVGISKLTIVGDGPGDEIQDIDLTFMRIYNRHLAGLTSPDDRDNPRIEFSTDLLPGRILAQGSFHLGRQNTLVEGVFGYREPDGSPAGAVPRRLRRVSAILAARLLQDPLGVDVFTSNPGRIRGAKTRDQSVTFGDADSGGVGPLTGDRIVDDILMEFLRPPYFGAVAEGPVSRSRQAGV
jgi:hypothetical protein